MHGGSRGHAPCIPGKRRGRAFMEGVGTMHSRTVVHFRAVAHGQKTSGVVHAQRVAGRACTERHVACRSRGGRTGLETTFAWALLANLLE